MRNLFSQETSVASAFGCQQVLVVNMIVSRVSAFCIHQHDIDLSGFNKLVASRKEYLDTLPSLGDKWISGESTPPSWAVIEKSKQLLDEFIIYLIQKKQQMMQVDVPKLVMGPIPTGGMEIEFHKNSENALYVSIFNNSAAEIELKQSNFFSTIKPADPNRGVIAGYELLGNANGNSGWGNTLSVL